MDTPIAIVYSSVCVCIISVLVFVFYRFRLTRFKREFKNTRDNTYLRVLSMKEEKTLQKLIFDLENKKIKESQIIDDDEDIDVEQGN